MNDINPYLNERSEELMVYKMPRNETLMDEIFEFDLLYYLNLQLSR